ncbi:nicotinate-nucleotide--dimethylbenzimidazole phosphoribosyltransferase [Halopseudomonas laoshanensis]|uniref:Nicotinate-nucleotide--dimethylbenzimidazole phosphoribosyltransferase n=1 Tax=Halopseudomonas laoshanensis TaxID=2268758 RepID=A0A7V7GSK7_9GAMM|nr:nicotinate-nucleotide--dimethylbenzimidazole phosphoribosyltransferase [Halopseudomonas laoshanensis]KAA0693473.1 nicotinate-nucleotide--dimethylbenzimidazole phosphoribosyltransferase [Halopseudomonas laoshanensis]
MSRPWWSAAVAQLDRDAMLEAQQRQSELTKPTGSLGQLEALAVQLAAMQGSDQPAIEAPWITIFAADHGVMAENVSAYPQSVTGEMLRNFSQGGAAICVLARHLGATLKVMDLGLAVPIRSLSNVEHRFIAPGTANFCRAPAMTTEQCLEAINVGQEAVLAINKADLFIGGEMGIGNSTSACALASALLGRPAALLVGPGTGLNKSGMEHKLRVIQRGLLRHAAHLRDPLAALSRLGGLEIAALTGAYLAAAQRGMPMLIDGYISSVAALCATRLNPGCREWMLFSHRSAEPGHTLVLQALQASPLLDLGMRLGEGSGAAVAVPLLRAACALHNQMATFAQADVSDRQPC